MRNIMGKYLGDKYLKAYKHYRTEQDDKISSLTARVADLERMIEWLTSYIVEGNQ